MSTYAPNEMIISHGKKIAYSDTLAGTYIDVTGTTDIGYPEAELGAAEVTNDSTPNFMKDYIPGLNEPGKVSFTYNYTKSQYAALETVFQLATDATTRVNATKFWKITLSDGSVGSVSGFMTKHTLPSSNGEDVHTVECEIQCRSKLTFTAAASV